ncbi:NAD(P)-binding domain-containing protein [Nocardia nepalensis]|uniref:NAD(P)-binding domain-containing protein n=1 Tax=Nocardia nepalensis TaxID=3375448 RepID=UPI003B67A8A0
MTYDVAIIGAGFSGLCAAIKLTEAGITDFVILEKADRVGGTWRDNDYPGAACDVMAQLYSFSFAPNTEWTQGYPGQAEILAYLERIVDRFDLASHLRFGTEVLDQRFDDDQDEWQLTSGAGTMWRARAVIAATGPLHLPKTPMLPGAESFAGSQFHSSRWDHTIDLAGKSVAVIGTGASAVQIVPAIADRAGSVTVYQRTPHWVLPRLQRPITAAERAVYRVLPGTRGLVRGLIYASHEAMIGAFLNPKLMGALRRVARWHLRKQVADPLLRAKLEPDYQIGCKRILISSDYYRALQRANVSVVTEPIADVVADGIRTGGGSVHAADVIVYATGFLTTEKIAGEHLYGRGGVPIQQLWRDGVQAYYGVAAHGLPNYFLTVGPNSGLGNQSVVFVIETQIELIVRCLRTMAAGGYSRVEVKSHIQAEFNTVLQRKSVGTVWTAGGCDSWYLDAAGVNRAIWPGSTLSYRHQVRRVDMRDFDFSRDDERDDNEVYSGSAVLIDADGGETAVETRILAKYEPVANTIKWHGRVLPGPSLAHLHTQLNQPIRLQIAGRDPVDGVLVDADPWGGAQVVGWGRSPYPIDVEAAFSEK